jgi:lysyl-tRNA synthetase class 1
VDWAMRWYALDIDFEMYGKDLIESAILSSRIVKLIGKANPSGFAYELFLDEKGEKISKSKGNGITIDQWLEYASPESLSLYMYQNPKRAKKLYKEIVPKTVDEYLDFIKKTKNQNELQLSRFFISASSASFSPESGFLYFFCNLITSLKYLIA